jgi:peroxiredoxin
MRSLKNLLLFLLTFPVIAAFTLYPANEKFADDPVIKESNKKGYSLKVRFNNHPQRLMVLQEWRPNGLVFIDSMRTDDSGRIEMSGVLKEGKICFLQFNRDDGVLLYLDNKSNLNMDISLDNQMLTYNVTGENSIHSTELKKVFVLNNNFYHQMMAIEQKAKDAPSSEIAVLRYQYQRLMQMKEQALANHIQSSPSGPSQYLAFKMMGEPPFEILEMTVNALSKDKNSKYYKELNEVYLVEKRTAIGSPAIDIELPDTSGSSTAMSSLKGKVILLDFWASWCRPCRMANPENVALYNKYKDQGFEIFAVSLDNNKNSWKRAIEMDSLTWTHVSDLKKWKSIAAASYRVHGIPATFLIDKKGNIAAKSLHGESLEAKIKELLAQ